MTPQEAAIVLATLLAGFPDKALEPESVKLWTQEIAVMGEFETVDRVARGFVRESDAFPTLHAFREGCARAAKDDADERARRTGLPEGPRKGIPEWVKVWWWARNAREPREERMFPQQAEPDAPAGAFMSKAEYDQLKGEWILAGSPGFELANLTGDIAEKVA